MGLERLWSVEFTSELGSEGGGVIVMEDGKILGGNNNYFYVGSYTVSADQFNATIDVKHYQGKCNPIFGKQEELILQLSGKSSPEEMSLSGHILEDTSRELHISLKAHTELFK